jgi:hypothetical protein
MTNPAMPGHVKIGSTKLQPDERARQLSSSTGVPRPFQVVAFQTFEDELRAEREIRVHFKAHRINSSREFYDISVEEARQELLLLSHTDFTPAITGPMPSVVTPDKPTPVQEQGRPDTNASVLGFSYWTRFNELREQQGLQPRFERAGARFFHRYFLVRPSQRTDQRNIHYEGRIRIKSPQVSMRLIFKRAVNIKELFDLIAQEKEAIEKEIALALVWSRNCGDHESHISIERDDTDPRDISEWESQHLWLSDVVARFENVLLPRVASLPAPHFNVA